MYEASLGIGEHEGEGIQIPKLPLFESVKGVEGSQGTGNSTSFSCCSLNNYATSGREAG